MIHTQKEFEDFVAAFKLQFPSPIGFGIYRPEVDFSGLPIGAQFLSVNYKENIESAAVLVAAIGTLKLTKDQLLKQKVFPISEVFLEMCFNYFEPIKDDTANPNHAVYRVIKELAEPGVDYSQFFVYMIFAPASSLPNPSMIDTYFQLYASSMGKEDFNTLNTSNVDIPNSLYWSADYPYTREYLLQNSTKLKAKVAYPIIDSVQIYPSYLHHLVYPDHSTFGPYARVELGAYIGQQSHINGYMNYRSSLKGKNNTHGDIINYIINEGSSLGLRSVLYSDSLHKIGKNTKIGNSVSIDNLNIGDYCIIESGVVLEASTLVTISDQFLQQLLVKSGQGTEAYQKIKESGTISNGILKVPFDGLQGLSGFKLTSEKEIIAV